MASYKYDQGYVEADGTVHQGDGLACRQCELNFASAGGPTLWLERKLLLVRATGWRDLSTVVGRAQL